MSAPVQSGPIIERDEESLNIVRSDGSRALAGAQRSAVAVTTESMQLLVHAVERGLTPEQIDKLVAVHFSMLDRQAERDFAAALAGFQAEARSVKHNKTAKITTGSGGSFSYGYASLDEMAESISKPLAKNGLSYRWDTRIDAQGMMTVDCIVSHEGGHSKTSSFTLPTRNDANKAMSEQQKFSAASKFARRLSLEAALGLTTTDTDRDVEEAEVDPTPLTREQADEIEDLLIQATDGFTPQKQASIRRRFFAYMDDVESIAQIPAVKYMKAVTALTPEAPKT